MADPLSIAASITGIITAAVKITTVLSDLHDAPDHIADLSAEVNNIRIVFKAFQRLIEKPVSLPSRRAAMIQLEDVVVIVTEIVLVFSELETIVTPLATRQRSKLRALTWVWQRSTTTRLVNQLQRHKSSLTVVLSIIACDSDIEAADAAAALQEKIEEQVEKSTDISERLERLQLSIEGQLQEPEVILPVDDDASVAQLHPDYQATLNEILENSTVYKRALHRSSNVGSSSSVVSRSWSIISGVSMTQISMLAVLNLPLYDNEIERFRDLVNVDGNDQHDFDVENDRAAHIAATLQQLSSQSTPPAPFTSRCYGIPSRTSLGAFQGVLRRLNKEFAAMERNPPEHFTCGPIGDDMFEWTASITGPPGTPYAGGIFFAAIHIPTEYPLKTPRINFTTRVYHPNINSNGFMSLDALGESWNPSMTIEKVLSNLVSFLGEPFRYSGNVPDTRCLVPEIGRIYWTDRERFNRTARDWTRRYAI